MSLADSPSVTRLLRAWSGGDEDALGRLVPLVYEELRRRARHHLARERPGNTLQPTALVNEVYLRLVDAAEVSWQDRAHFFAITAQMMRRILVDAARARGTAKRGGAVPKIALDERLVGAPAAGRELLRLDDAIESLARKDPRKAKVVELRFFGGLSLQETAESLRVSEDTVGRDWNFAKAWLAREIR
ncbi:MAG: sigma-70 family RNA polymerase sigma factor [Bryobacteraceae bacterium]